MYSCIHTLLVPCIPAHVLGRGRDDYTHFRTIGALKITVRDPDKDHSRRRLAETRELETPTLEHVRYRESAPVLNRHIDNEWR